MTDEKAMSAPPVIRRLNNGLLQLEVGGYPVEGVVQICTTCDCEGSMTTILFHNSAVIFDVEHDGQAELN